MSTALTLAPSDHSSPHLQSRDSDPHSHHPNARHYSSSAAARSPGTSSRRAMSSPSSSKSAPNRNASPVTSDEQRRNTQNVDETSPQGKESPRSGGNSSVPKQPPRTQPPKIKTEHPPSPESSRPVQTPATARHRPRRLDLSNNTQAGQSIGSARLTGPSTSRDSAPLSAIQDVGLACLSPGFQTHDPQMQQQLARSMDLREQQRQIIEARLNSKSAKDGGSGSSKDGGPHANSFTKPPGSSKRRGPPPGLSITAPSAAQFASEPRVIQSAPLHQTFTGLRPAPPHAHPLSRQAVEQHHHRHEQERYAPAAEQQGNPPQSSTRLPPIQDIISQPAESFTRSNGGPTYGQLGSSSNRSPQSNQPGRSPGFPPINQSHQSSSSSRHEREYRSAEEAVQGMTGGREDLLPKIVHYGGHQPPTPPSPLPPHRSQQHMHYQHSAAVGATGHGPVRRDSGFHEAGTARRRNRDSFERDQGEGDAEDDGSGRRESKRVAGPFGYGRDSPETQRRKKEEFMGLCARAWDLFHS